MRWPFFGGDRGDRPISINLPVEMSPSFAVFFRAGAGSPPGADALPGVVTSWLGRHATDPLRGLLGDWVDKGMLSIHVVPKPETPPLDLDGLRGTGMSAEQEQKLAGSTHAALVFGKDFGLPPHPGLWVAVAAALALVEGLDGVAFDMNTRRLLKPGAELEDLPEMGQIVIPNHLAFDRERTGAETPALVSRGMAKFGLPDLVLRYVPDDLLREASASLGGIAALLAGWAAPLRDSSGGRPVRAKLDSNWRLTRAQILAAHAVDPSDPEVGSGGATTVHFETDQPTRRSPLPRLQVIPAGPTDDPEAAVRRMVAELFGAPANYTEFPADFPGLNEALAQVAADLPGVKARFLAGLPVDTRLSLKHGFPTGLGRKEYIWVGVESWTGDCIRGRLENDPVHRADLSRGQAVELGEGEVFDWLITHPDGSREGARVNDLLAKASRRGELAQP
jgi:hypothetical protein